MKLEGPSLTILFLVFLRLGISAFGGPAMVAYIRRLIVEQKGWLDSAIFDNGIALCQAIPGATAMQVAAYAGLRIHGTAGALAAFLGFGLPAFILMMVLSALYVSTSELPLVKTVLLALQALIVAIIAYATISLGRASLKHWIHVSIVGISAVLFIAGIHPIAIIGLAALLGIALLPPVKNQSPIHEKIRPHDIFFYILLAITATFYILLFILDSELFVIAFTMTRIDLFAFGGGYASTPLMFQEVVTMHSWLDSDTFINGLALGQVTPGPIIITATFVGYLTYGVMGGIIATIAIFIPSFLLLIGVVPYYDKLLSSHVYQKMFQGILLSVVGLLLSVTIKMALVIPWSLFSGLLAGGAFVCLLLGVEILWVIIAAIGIAAGMFLIIH